MPRASHYSYVSDTRELAEISAEISIGKSLVAAAASVILSRPSNFAGVSLENYPSPDQIDDYPWSKDDCMDLNGIRWAARVVNGIIVVTRSTPVVGLSV